MSNSIVTDKLTKYYGKDKLPALDALSLQVQPGEIYGFLGANGAGKSTAIRLLMNFLSPSSGSAAIMGLDIVKDTVAVKKQVGYLAGDIAIFQKPTGRQVLDYLDSLQKATKYRAVLEKRFKADLDKPMSDLSKGNRQKIGIIQAFMHQPAVLILDEPTSGLDPLMQEAFYETVLESKQQGAAILMSSHNLTEAQRICDRIGIIKRGRLIREESIGSDARLGATTFKVKFSTASDLKLSKAAAGLKFVSQLDPQTAIFKPTSTLSAALQTFGRFAIEEFSTETLDLEDEFLEFYGDKS
ncbi:MAG: ABC transporter ATP-binding protein [Patescibacteria group bacterium]|nr:ABC transporter ATP-binding protein [Patescibacteria group bacterium]